MERAPDAFEVRAGEAGALHAGGQVCRPVDCFSFAGGGVSQLRAGAPTESAFLGGSQPLACLEHLTERGLVGARELVDRPRSPGRLLQAGHFCGRFAVAGVGAIPWQAGCGRR